MGLTNSLFRVPENQKKYIITRRSPEEYDWIPDLIDRRDIHYDHPRMIKIKNSVCLKLPATRAPSVTPSSEGSVAKSITGVYCYEYNKHMEEDILFDSSFLGNIQSMIYVTKEKQLLYSIRDGLKLTASIGTLSSGVSGDSEKYNSIQYRYVRPKETDLQLALCFDHPVLFGISIYESQKQFIDSEESDQIFPQPGGRMLGGLCCVISGYDVGKGCFLIQGLGKKDVWIPFKRILEEGTCFWIISKTRVTKITEEYSFRDVT